MPGFGEKTPIIQWRRVRRFEPSRAITPCPFSKGVPSATQPTRHNPLKIRWRNRSDSNGRSTIFSRPATFQAAALSLSATIPYQQFSQRASDSNGWRTLLTPPTVFETAALSQTQPALLAKKTEWSCQLESNQRLDLTMVVLDPSAMAANILMQAPAQKPIALQTLRGPASHAMRKTSAAGGRRGGTGRDGKRPEDLGTWHLRHRLAVDGCEKAARQPMVVED